MTRPARKKCTYGALLLAVAVVLPQAFHLTGIPNAGNVFLPMHIPVLLAGLLLGQWYGMALGIAAPIISAVLTGMPAPARLPFMLFELCGYGFFAGLCFHTFGWHKKRGGIYLSLISAMVFGRLLYTAAVVCAMLLFHIEAGGWLAAVQATVTGVSGIVLQLTFIPPLVYALGKAGLTDDFFTRSESASS